MKATEDLRIREYTVVDRATCLEIFDSNRPGYFAEHEREEFADWLDRPDRASYSVIEVEGRVVGCGGIYRDTVANCVGLAWGMVHRDMHGRGIGRCLSEFRLDQMDDLFPESEQRLATSQHTFEFYQKLGFEVVTITPNGFGEGIDRYDMIRHNQRIGE